MSTDQTEFFNFFQNSDIVFSQEIRNLDDTVLESAFQELIDIFGYEGIVELQSQKLKKRLRTYHVAGREDNMYFFESIFGEEIPISANDHNKLLPNMTEFDLILIINIQSKTEFQTTNKRLSNIIKIYKEEFEQIAKEIDPSNFPFYLPLPLQRKFQWEFRQTIPQEITDQRNFLKQIRSIGNQGLNADTSQINRKTFAKFGRAMHKIARLEQNQLYEFLERTNPLLNYFRDIFTIYDGFGNSKLPTRNSINQLNLDMRNARFAKQKDLILQVFAPSNVFDYIQASEETNSFIEAFSEILNIDLLELRDIFNLNIHEDPYISMSGYFANLIYTLSSLNQLISFKMENYEELAEFDFEKTFSSEMLGFGQLDGIKIDHVNNKIRMIEIKTSPNLFPKQDPSKKTLIQIRRYIEILKENYPSYDIDVWYVESSATKVKSKTYTAEEINDIFLKKKRGSAAEF